MSTTSFGEQAIAALENQVDATPQTPRRRVKRKTWQTIIWFVVLLAIAAVVLYPLVWLFLSTFKPNSEFGSNPGLIPNNPTLDNYVKVSEGIGRVIGVDPVRDLEAWADPVLAGQEEGPGRNDQNEQSNAAGREAPGPVRGTAWDRWRIQGGSFLR